MLAPTRFLAALVAAAGAAGVLAGMSVVVRHNSERAAVAVGQGAAVVCSSPEPDCRTAAPPPVSVSVSPPVDHIARFAAIRAGSVVRGKVVVVVVLRRGVKGPVHYWLDGPGHYRGNAFKQPYRFPDNSKIWDTTQVRDGRYVLSISVGNSAIERQIGFTVANTRAGPD